LQHYKSDPEFKQASGHLSLKQLVCSNLQHAEGWLFDLINHVVVLWGRSHRHCSDDDESPFVICIFKRNKEYILSSSKKL